MNIVQSILRCIGWSEGAKLPATDLQSFSSIRDLNDMLGKLAVKDVSLKPKDLHRFNEENEEVILSKDLPSCMGKSETKLQTVSLELPKDKQAIERAYNRLPRYVVTDPLRFRLAATEFNGAGGSDTFIAGVELTKGTFTPVAIKLFALSDKRDDFYIMKEAVLGELIGRTGCGPSVHGIVSYDGRVGIVMEPVAGEFSDNVQLTAKSLNNLLKSVIHLAKAGITHTDSQQLILQNEDVQLIDYGSLGSRHDDGYVFALRGYLTSIVREVKKACPREISPDELSELRKQLETLRSLLRFESYQSDVTCSLRGTALLDRIAEKQSLGDASGLIVNTSVELPLGSHPYDVEGAFMLHIQQRDGRAAFVPVSFTKQTVDGMPLSREELKLLRTLPLGKAKHHDYFAKNWE